MSSVSRSKQPSRLPKRKPVSGTETSEAKKSKAATARDVKGRAGKDAFKSVASTGVRTEPAVLKPASPMAAGSVGAAGPTEVISDVVPAKRGGVDARIAPLLAKMDGLLARSGLPKDELALQRSFVMAMLDHPGVGGYELLKYVDASSQREALRGMLPELKKSIDAIHARAESYLRSPSKAQHRIYLEAAYKPELANETVQQLVDKTEALASFYTERLAQAQAMVDSKPSDVKGGPPLSYADYLQAMSDYVISSKYGHEDDEVGLIPSPDELRADKAGMFSDEHLPIPSRFAIFSPRALGLSEMVKASAANIHYIQLQKFDEAQVNDGIVMDDYESAGHDGTHYAYMWMYGDKYHDPRPYQGTEPKHAVALLEKVIAGLELTERVDQFIAGLPTQTEREAAGWFWFEATHESSNEVIRADVLKRFESRKTFDEGYKPLLEKIADRKNLGPLFTHPEEVTKELLRALNQKFIDVLSVES